MITPILIKFFDSGFHISTPKAIAKKIDNRNFFLQKKINFAEKKLRLTKNFAEKNETLFSGFYFYLIV